MTFEKFMRKYYTSYQISLRSGDNTIYVNNKDIQMLLVILEREKVRRPLVSLRKTK